MAPLADVIVPRGSTTADSDPESQIQEQKQQQHQQQQPENKKREVLWVRFWREVWVLKHILYVLSVDSKLALSKTPFTTLFWWTIGDPQSRPWFWLKAIVFLMIDLGLLVTSLVSTYAKDTVAGTLLMVAAPVQFFLFIVSIIYFFSALHWFETERGWFLKQEEAANVKTHEQATRLFAHLEDSYSPSWGVILFELASFAAAYISFIASLFIVYRDSEEADPVALALGVFSCLDLGMGITGMFGNAVNRLTNNKKLMKYSSIMLCLVFFPIVILSLATYASAVVDAQYPGIADTFGFPETDKEERLLPKAATIVLTLIYSAAFVCASCVLCMCRVCISSQTRMQEDASVLTNQTISGTTMDFFKPYGRLTQAREVAIQNVNMQNLNHVIAHPLDVTQGVVGTTINKIKQVGGNVKTQLAGVHVDRERA